MVDTHARAHALMITFYRHGHATVHARRQLVVCTRSGSRWRNEADGRSNRLVRVARCTDFIACSCLVTEASKGGRAAVHLSRCGVLEVARGAQRCCFVGGQSTSK